MESNKRIRSTNWDDQEKKVLRGLVLEQVDILEKKDTSTNSNSAKKLAWDGVLSRFNAVSPNKRDMSQILNQWRNMKNRAKKSEFAFRRARMMTGGGPPPASPPPEDQELIDGIPNEFSIDSNCYDSDTLFLKKDQQCNKTEIPELVVEMETTQDFCESSAPALPETSQVVLKTPGSSHRVRKKQIKRKFDCCDESHEHQLFILAKKSRDVAMLREKEAHEFKMKNEREVHESRMAVMSLEKEYWQMKINSIK